MSSLSVSICPRCGARDTSGFLAACPNCLLGADAAEANPVFAENYEVLETIGRGGAGVVYRARHLRLLREVALKVMDEALASQRQVEDRLESEGQAMAALTHPNIVAVYDVGRYDGHGYVAMEYVEGWSLAELIPLPLPRLLGIADQLCAALSHAHRAGVIHCDLKPANVLVDADDHVKLSDFGIAQWGAFSAAKAARIMGTPRYMAPELLRGAAPTARTDIYALGVVLHEMLTGTLPAPGSPLSAGPLQAVLARALAPDPRDRYASAGEVRADLARVSAASPVPRLSPGETRARQGVALLQAFVGTVGLRESVQGLLRALDAEEPLGRRTLVAGPLALGLLWGIAAWTRANWRAEEGAEGEAADRGLAWSRALPVGGVLLLVWGLRHFAVTAGNEVMAIGLAPAVALLQTAALYVSCHAWLNAVRAGRVARADPAFRVSLLLAVAPALLDVLTALLPRLLPS